jgi:hypothetical protein
MTFNWRGANKKKIIIGVIIVVLIGWYLYNQDRRIVRTAVPGVREGRFEDRSMGGAMGGAVEKENFSFMGGAAERLAAPMVRQEIAQVDQMAQEEVVTEDRKVVRTGVLSLVVDKAEEAARQVQNIAKGAGGFVENLQIYELSEGRKSGSVTVRVPADLFREVMDNIKGLAVNVESETVNAQDVTEQYVDMEARLKNMRAEEGQYQEIMKRAEKVEDILNVAQRLSDVRGRIERLEARLKLLKEEVEMSTITVSLMAEGDIEIFGVHWRPLVVVKQSFRDMLESLTEYVDEMIRFVFKLPALLLWIVTLGIGIGIAWKIIKWARGKWFSG